MNGFVIENYPMNDLELEGIYGYERAPMKRGFFIHLNDFNNNEERNVSDIFNDQIESGGLKQIRPLLPSNGFFEDVVENKSRLISEDFITKDEMGENLNIEISRVAMDLQSCKETMDFNISKLGLMRVKPVDPMFGFFENLLFMPNSEVPQSFNFNDELEKNESIDFNDDEFELEHPTFLMYSYDFVKISTPIHMSSLHESDMELTDDDGL
ncbi:hypothetical protein HELRODRAFT_177670 [Helobdella robusta]|uniref:Uncharacterized protein n=1 Tax=Helobdella robusta TaxID=6412 RepID=T1FC17_HELRO|nr:hypothetical protein HELRODRAFT_177670 [Helobdella robusta]ESN97997.1 hypothetical protein HELRODRAFT_177670 [Helobdella robusta]